MLWIEQAETMYDLSRVKPGDLIYARHDTWDSGRGGFVTSATEKQLTVQYHPGIGNVTNHFHIPVAEAVGGQWEIRWSADMSEVFSYNMSSKKGPESEIGEVPEIGEMEGTKESDEIGGVDL